MTGRALRPTGRTGRRATVRYATLLQNMAEGFLLCEAIRDGDGRLVDYWLRLANPVFEQRAPSGHVVGRRQLQIRPATDPAWFATCQRALDGEPVRFEFQDPLDGRWYEVHMTRMSETHFGQFFVDVSARKAVERRQTELFAELNHRVKNNLAITSAVLNLQARQSGPGLREALSKAADRIHSIADLHAALYQQNSTDKVDLQSYLQTLAQRLSETVSSQRPVRVTVHCPPLTLSMTDAVNLGLIVNELVTNAAKHAFGCTPEPAVDINVKVERKEFTLTVKDNGDGFDPDRRTGGLGLQLVNSLVEGLGGSLAFTSKNGACVEIHRPLTDAVPPPPM